MKKKIKSRAKKVVDPGMSFSQADVSDEMSDQQMTNLLAELANTIYWQAILKFNQRQDVPAVSGLATLDPFKEPTQVARTQGWRGGLYYLERFVKEEIEKRRKVAEEAEKRV